METRQRLDELDWRIYSPRYRDWDIDTPTTRRLQVPGGGIVWPAVAYKGTSAEGCRIFLTADNRGDNNLYLCAQTDAELARESLVPPAPRQRFGTWARYLATVTWAKAAIATLGGSLTDEEQALLEALESYGRQAPARLRGTA